MDGYHASDFVDADQTNSITGSMIEDNSVSSSDLEDNAVTSTKIDDGTIQQTDLSFSPPDGHSLDAADGAPINAIYVDDNGNVGIGTTDPSSKVEVVNGSMNAKLSYFFKNIIGLFTKTYNYTGIKGSFTRM